MPEFELTREYVVQTVEILSGVENIGQKTRREPKRYLRYVVYALLHYYFPHDTYEWKAETFSQDHATVIHALKKWRQAMRVQKYYAKYVKIYDKATRHINLMQSHLMDDIKKVEEFNNTNENEEIKESIDKILDYFFNFTA